MMVQQKPMSVLQFKRYLTPHSSLRAPLRPSVLLRSPHWSTLFSPDPFLNLCCSSTAARLLSRYCRAAAIVLLPCRAAGGGRHALRPENQPERMGGMAGQARAAAGEPAALRVAPRGGWDGGRHGV
jgi:hypothetical protein